MGHGMGCGVGCMWIVGFGYGHEVWKWGCEWCGVWGMGCGVVRGLEHPYILIRIFSMLSGPAPMLPEVV